MHDRRFPGHPDALRNPRRVSLMEPEQVADHCLDHAEIRTVLDVGSGSGLFTEVFAARGLAVGALDVSPRMVRATRDHVPEACLAIALAEVLPFADDAFDLVLISHVLHETDDRVRTLREAHRVARQRVAVLEWPRWLERDGPPRHHRLSVEQVCQMAADAGFRDRRVITLEAMELYLFNV